MSSRQRSSCGRRGERAGLLLAAWLLLVALAAPAVAASDAALDSALETRLQTLRGRQLALARVQGPHVIRSERGAGREAASEDRETEVLARALAELEADARDRGADGLRAFALVFQAELAERAGRGREALKLLDRALRVPESDATWEAHVMAETLRERVLTRPAERSEARTEALRALRRAAGLLARARGRIDASDYLARARPVHERLAGHLLAESRRTPARSDALLREAVDILEELKVAELHAYFGDDCLASLTPTTPELLPDTLVLYPVVLEDRVELIVGRDGRFTQQLAPIAPQALVEESRRLRARLQDPTSPRYRESAARLYDALIRPIGPGPAAEAMPGEAASPSGRVPPTLVFVPSGALREVPIAALFDARTRRFLIEQVAVATLPSLRILPSAPIDRRRTRMLVAGLTRAVEGFEALPFVAQEIEAVAARFRSEQRVDAAFSRQGFADAFEARAYDVVHIASHGRFDADAAESFLVAADGRLGLPELAEIVRGTRHRTSRPLELLSLSACETALGDEQAVLGLAGVAVQSGARSAVATLWRVNDEAAARLFAAFYAELGRPGVSRAEALRRAQRGLLAEARFRHPIHWSAFLLINSWL